MCDHRGTYARPFSRSTRIVSANNAFTCYRRYILAEVSGANLNPAVSIGLLVGKRISVERFIIYVIAQVCLPRRSNHRVELRLPHAPGNRFVRSFDAALAGTRGSIRGK